VFLNATSTADIYTPSLHDALPISFARNSHITEDNLRRSPESAGDPHPRPLCAFAPLREIHLSQTMICGNHRIHREIHAFGRSSRSEEHTSELQSRENLVCRLLLEK